MESFSDLVYLIQKEGGWRVPHTAPGLLQSWREFMRRCSSGYEWGMYEYANDLAIRDQINEVLNDGRVKIFREFIEFSSDVENIDQEFRKLFIKNVSLGVGKNNWWRQGILRRGGQEYVDDIKRTYNIDVELAQ